MSRPKLRALAPLRSGAPDAQTGLNGRRFIRTMGCWNCIHGNFEAAGKLWSEKRLQELNQATKLALESKMGEEDPIVKNIRSMVTGIDQGIRSGALTRCTGQGVDANDNPVGTFVKSNYLCRNWSAKQGASVAREGQKADDLPMELEDKYKGDGSDN